MPTLKHIEILESSVIRNGYRLAVITNWYKGYPYKVIEQKFRLNESEGAALFCLGQSAGLSATDICAITGRPKNSISRAVNVLLRKKLITRRDDIRDRRRKILDLTEEGFQIYKQSEQLFLASERRILSPLSKEEMKALDAILSKLLRGALDWADLY